MSTVNLYRIYCETDDQYEQAWSENILTQCPVNNTHTVTANSVQLLNSVSNSIVEIKDLNSNVGGDFRIETKKITAPVGESTHDYSWKIPIRVHGIKFVTVDEHKGDIINNDVAPDTLIGSITSDVAIGDDVISVTTSVIQSVKLGYYITLDDGVNSESLGYVTSINTNTNEITTELQASNSYLASTPTNVYMTLRHVINYEIGEPQTHSLGDMKIGGALLDANTISRVRYINNGASPKDFIFSLEYMY